MSRMPAWKFKDRCLKVLDEVAASNTPVTITRRGKPVAIVMPYGTQAAATSSLAGSVLKERGNPFGTHETWNA
jgi:prevent-host-death family protein